MESPPQEEIDRFVQLYYQIYLFMVEDYKMRTGDDLKTYKNYEPEYLEKFYRNYGNEDDLIEQISSFTSQLIILQAFPNANHRTAFLFTKYYLKKHGANLKIYEDEKQKYDIFYSKSKYLIGQDINHFELYNDHYIDSHHSSGIQEHKESLKTLFKEIVDFPQSGIVTVESFHSFVASMNQSGSLPGSNQ